jgi:hypothetical protein
MGKMKKYNIVVGNSEVKIHFGDLGKDGSNFFLKLIMSNDAVS